MRNLLVKISFILCTLLLGVNTMWGQSYHDGVWCSLYDDENYGTKWKDNKDVTIHTYTDIFVPIAGNVIFDAKLEGNSVSYSSITDIASGGVSTSSSFADPHKWGVTNPFTLKVGGISKDIVLNVTGVQKSAKPVFTRYYYYEYSYDYTRNQEVTGLSENTTSFAVVAPKNGTNDGHSVLIEYMRVPTAKHIWLQNADGSGVGTSLTKNFDNVIWETSAGATINFRSFLTNGNISVTIVGDDRGDFSFSSSSHAVHSLSSSAKGRTFAVGANRCASANGAANTYCSAENVLGRASEYDFTVYYYPKKENVGTSYTGNGVYVLISDGKSSAKVYLRGNCIKRNQTISWDNSNATYNTTDNITYNAVANDAISGTASGVSVTYSPTSGSPAYMSGNALQIVTSGNTTITASAGANTYYNAATPVTKNITINKVTPTVTWPVIASGLKYNETCAIGDKVSDHWTGGSAKDDKNSPVAGTFVCNADLLPANNVSGYLATFNPTNTNWYNSTSATIYGAVAKADQTISWGLTENVEYATGTLMDATATSGQAVNYTPNASGVGVAGYINENNRLVVVEPNQTITITALQAGDDNWNPASATKTIITLGANPNQYTDVHASDITYGDLLSASTLSGTVYLNEVEIAGTLSWVDPTIMPVAGTANHMVLFTPTNTAAYSPVYFEVPVKVGKANPVITWNISEVLRENVRYSNFVVSSNKEVGGELSYQTSNSTLLNIADGVLTTGEVSAKQSGWIKVSQPETANYNAYNTSWTLQFDVNVYPKNDKGACLPFLPMDESDYNNALEAITEPGGWCGTDFVGSDTYDVNMGLGTVHVPVSFTQRIGIQLGSWRGGWSYGEKSVDLSFSGIPDSITFAYEVQTVTAAIDFDPTAIKWWLYESPDGENYTELVYLESLLGTDYKSGKIEYKLDENTRFVRIVYGGNFAGFVKNLRITQKRSFTADKTSLTFGTEDYPLQEPQNITLTYSSIGGCGTTDDAITVESSNPAFYVDEPSITENVGVEQKGTYTIRVRCNDVNQSGTLTFSYPTTKEGTKTYTVSVNSEKPNITTTATKIFQTGTEHVPASGTSYRALRTHNFSDCFNGSDSPVFDTLYIYGVSESDTTTRAWEYSPAKGYKVPVVEADNVHTPCFVYKKDGSQYTYVRTFDASTKTLNVADSNKRGFVGYRAEAPAANAIQVSGASAEIYLNNTEIVATGAPLAVNATSAVHANGTNILSSTGNAAVQLSGATTLSIEDTWKGATSAILALRPAASYPSIDLGSASGRVDINGTQLELHNNTAHHLAIAHMDGTTEKYDGEVHINDGSIGGEATLGMPKATFIDGGTFNDGTVAAYTVKGMPKRPRNSNGDMLSRHTMTPAALAAYTWYGQAHLTPDGAAKVNPMLMDEEVWIFTGKNGTDYDDEDSWNKDGLPGKDDDVLINAPMIIDGNEMKVKSLTINWEDKGKGIPAVTVNPAGGLTVGEGGIDGLKVNMINNLALKADNDPSSATKGQTGFLRVNPAAAEPMPEATVELYSIGYYDRANATDDANIAAWQCVGAPIEDAHVYAKSVYTQSWVYSWDENRNEWVNNRKNLEFEPFKGFETTQFKSVDGVLLTYTGQLVSGAESRTIPLAVSAKEKGYNLLANSYSAPMVISQFQNADFVNAESTIYILNAGTKDQSDKPGESKDAAGKFIGVPINLSPTELEAAGYPTTVSSMQGFWVKAKEPGETAQLALDYSRLVWGQTYKDSTAAKPLRAPKSQEVMEDPISGSLKVAIQANGWTDYIYLLESENFDTAYEDGYDAHRIPSGDMDIFTIEDNDYLGLDATNSIVGTRVGMRTGAEVIYIMSFSHLRSEKELALVDNETNQKININEGTIYPFYAAPNSEITNRFQIVARNDAPIVTTGVDGVTNETKAYKFIKDGQMYILKNGVLYNATGAIVR